jgi:tetratricopeptide (TPR) repeat protein
MSGNHELFRQSMSQGHSAAWEQNWFKAAALYRQALDEFPEDPQALTSLGLALYEQKKYDEALTYYQQAARLSKEDPIPMEKVAELLEKLGNEVNAARTYLRAAELYLKNRELVKALENWNQVIQLDPENITAHTRLAGVYERIGEGQRAASEYLAVAGLAQHAGDMERAVRSVNQALQIMPNHSEAIQALTLLRDFKDLPKPTRPPARLRKGTAPLKIAQIPQLEGPKGAGEQDEQGADPVAQASQRALAALAGMLFDFPEDNLDDLSEQRDLVSIARGKSKTPRQLDRTKIMLHLGQVVDLQSNEQYAQAAEELERAIEAGLLHPAVYFNLGYLYYLLGKETEAYSNLQYAVKNRPYALAGHLLMGEILRKMGRLKDGSIEYLEALCQADSQVVPENQAEDLLQLYEPIIEAHRHDDDPEFQTRLCENIAGLLMRPDWRDQMVRARTQMPVQGSEAPVIPLAEILTEARSSQVVDSLGTIYQLANSGNLRAAMEESFYAIQFAPTYLPLHTYMGELLVKQGLVQDAVAKLLAVARTYNTRGEPHRAVDVYQRIIDFAPMDLAARSLLIDQLISMGQITDAINEYMELADVYYSLADLDMTRKTYSDALRLAQTSHLDRSWRVQVLHRMADIDLQSLDWRQALRIFEQIRNLDPNDEKSRSSLIELNFRLGQEHHGLGELDDFLRHLAGSGQRKKAQSFLEDLVRENPERVAVRRRLAEFYRQTGMRKQAIEELDKIGEALLESDDRAGALKVIEEILSLDPTNAQDYQNLLY